MQDREDTAMCDGTLCLLVFGEKWASVDSFPYLSLLNLLVGNKGSRREREDAHLLCYTLERQLLLALVFMATAQRLVGFLVLFLL